MFPGEKGLVSHPYFGLSVRMRLTLPKVGVGSLESFGTPKNSEDDLVGQNTSP